MNDDAGVMRISASGRVPASATEIFAVVADPDGHVVIDGSGMLMSAPDAQPFVTVGWTFTMSMDREPLTNYCDWTNLDERLREHVTFPIVPRSMLEASVEKLRAHLSDHPEGV